MESKRLYISASRKYDIGNDDSKLLRIHKACRDGDMKTLKKLLQQNENVNNVDYW